MQPTAAQQILGRALIVAATLIWGFSFVILKSTLDTISPLWTMAIRFIAGALLMLIVCVKQLKLLNKKYLTVGLLLGVTLFASYVLQTYGLKLTTPGKNAFLTSVYCVLVPFLGRLIFKTRLDRHNVLAAFVCIAGVGFVSLKSDLTVGLGDGLTLLCGVFFALQILILDRNVGSMSIELLSILQFGVAGILSLILAPIFEAPPTHIPTDTLWGLAYLCVMCTVCAYLFQSHGQRYTPASASAVLLSLEAVFGAVGSAIFFKEEMTAQLIAGFVLIFVAVIISETKLGFLRRKRGKPVADN